MSDAVPHSSVKGRHLQRTPYGGTKAKTGRPRPRSAASAPALRAPPAAIAMTPAEIAKLTVPKLKAELKDRGLDATGLKKVLVERLTAALAAPAAPPSPAKAAAPAELEGTKLKGRLKNLDVQLREAINTCLAEHHADDAGPEGWVDISLLTPVLRRRAPDWDVRNYGVNKSAGLSGLLKLPELSELFELNAQPQEAADRDSKQVLLTVVYSVRVKPGVTWVSP